jgi:predicted AlkP superfamily phosphohydrolase/phosphomutase
MRVRFALLLIAGLACGCARGNGGGAASGKRVIILGFDGLDYEYTKKLMEEGKLPNFSRVAREGRFGPLETSIPPQSPVAWSNFITGKDSGGHGIFDFVHRTGTLFVFSMSEVTGRNHAQDREYQFPLSGGSFELLRPRVLGGLGNLETTILRMPANFLPQGRRRELSGIGTPDLAELRVLLLHLKSSPSRAVIAGGTL